jgi:hypothetical protein
MTKRFNQNFHCPNCKTWNTAETIFGRWLRNNPLLASHLGTCVLDSDYWVHQFKTYNPSNGRKSRDVQCIMLVEVKTNGCDLDDAQRDTLHIVNQILRNRRQTPTKKLIHQAGTSVVKVRSVFSGAMVDIWCYGAHLLRFSGLGPDDSSEIIWDNKHAITKDQLTSLLNFDTHPDTLNPMDFRIHHYKEVQADLLVP